MKKSICIAVLALLSGVSVGLSNTVFWAVPLASSYTWLDHNNLAMDGTPSASSYLVQLIYAGADGIDPVNLVDADGTGGNDVMVAFSRFGNATSPRTDGKFEASYNNSVVPYVNGSVFYMRAWEIVSAGSGSITSSGGTQATWYGNSMTFTLTGYNPDPSLESDANFYATANLGGATGPYAMQAVPEPTTVALLGLGLAIVALRRRAA